MSDVARVPGNLIAVHARIAAACKNAGRDMNSVELIAVSKNFSSQNVQGAVLADHCHFGESKLQEAEDKIASLPGSLHWHFIGRIQRNKVRRIIQQFEVIHSVDSLKLALDMNEIAGQLGLRPKVFIQVNIGSEESKAGFEIEKLTTNIKNLIKLDRLEILGLMCIPPRVDHPESSRTWFASLRELRDALVSKSGVRLPFLSMGMSDDFEIAIQEGSTHVRVGTAIFGKRDNLLDGETPIEA